MEDFRFPHVFFCISHTILLCSHLPFFAFNYFTFIGTILLQNVCKLSRQFISLCSRLTQQPHLNSVSVQWWGQISLTRFPTCRNTVYVFVRAKTMLQELVHSFGCVLRMSPDPRQPFLSAKFKTKVNVSIVVSYIQTWAVFPSSHIRGSFVREKQFRPKIQAKNVIVW